MRTLYALLALMVALPLKVAAQDDVYFSTDDDYSAQKAAVSDDKPAYYSGSNRSVDDYNRHGQFRSQYQKIGQNGNDSFRLETGNGTYPDSTYVDTTYVGANGYDGDDDYNYTRRMNRFDNYWCLNPWIDDWYDPWYYDYGWGWGPYWRSAYWGWYDPWYYGGYWGWYDPWYYSYYPWGYYGYGWGPYWGGVYVNHGHYGSGTRNHSYNAGTTGGNMRFGGSRAVAGTGNHSAGAPAYQRFGSRSSGSTTYNNNNGMRFGGSRASQSTRTYNNNSTYSAPSRSTSGFNGSFGGSRSSFGGGSFGGGSFGGGSFGGGGHSGGFGGGGGHFGGHR